MKRQYVQRFGEFLNEANISDSSNQPKYKFRYSDPQEYDN